MLRPTIAALLFVAAGISFCSVQAERSTVLRSPKPGVLCDLNFCADDTGVSLELTAKYIGAEAASTLRSLGHFDTKAFTFSTGIFCDVRERLCRRDRYFEDGERAPVDEEHTKLLFRRKAS